MNNNQDVLNEKQESQNKAHSVEIIVNGRSFEIAEKEIAFEELVKLAFGNVESDNNTAYTVTYSYKLYILTRKNRLHGRSEPL